MGDMNEVFQAMKDHRKMTRRQNIEAADAQFDQFLEAAAIGGYSLTKMSEFHWNVHLDGVSVAQYWPSANKWQITKTGRIHHGNHESFRLRLKTRRIPMTVLSAQTIRKMKLVSPLVDRTQDPTTGTSYGLSACGYDVRLDQNVTVLPGQFCLASAMELFRMTDDVVGIVHDKSTWARRGIAVQNTVIEPGWFGYLTLELTNHGTERLTLPRGTPIAQILFHYLDRPTDQPYSGKYQHQERGPQIAR